MCAHKELPNCDSKIMVHSSLKKGTETPILQREWNLRSSICSTVSVITIRLFSEFLLMDLSIKCVVESSQTGLS